jgi:rare lipoprotein A
MVMSPTAKRITTLAAALALGWVAPAAAQEAAPAGPTGGAEATPDAAGLTVSPGALLNRTVTVRGRLGEGDAGRPVCVERLLPDGGWEPLARSVVQQDGTFRVPWRTDRAGRVTLRATVDRDGAATAASSPLTAQLTVFRPAVASWYGPRFFGRRTACGQTLRRTTVGVAHRTLPCGTRVQLYRGGRTITVPVIDRGPFVRGRDWDLTQAAAQRLGVRATVRIGYLPPAGTPLRRARR